MAIAIKKACLLRISWCLLDKTKGWAGPGVLLFLCGIESDFFSQSEGMLERGPRQISQEKNPIAMNLDFAMVAEGGFFKGGTYHPMISEL